MKVKMLLKLEVLSFEGFASKSLVYSEILDELGNIVSNDGSVFGNRLVCPNDHISLNFEVSK